MRSINSLKNSGISTLGDLVGYSEDELLKVKNVGEKALTEIAEMLQRESLNFGMKFEDRDGELMLLEEGSTPVAAATAAGAGESAPVEEPQ